MKANELKTELEALGFDTIKKRADALNTPFGTYYKWETGKRRVPSICEVAIRGLKLEAKK